LKAFLGASELPDWTGAAVGAEGADGPNVKAFFRASELAAGFWAGGAANKLVGATDAEGGAGADGIAKKFGTALEGVGLLDEAVSAGLLSAGLTKNAGVGATGAAGFGCPDAAGSDGNSTVDGWTGSAGFTGAGGIVNEGRSEGLVGPPATLALVGGLANNEFEGSVGAEERAAVELAATGACEGLFAPGVATLVAAALGAAINLDLSCEGLTVVFASTIRCDNAFASRFCFSHRETGALVTRVLAFSKAPGPEDDCVDAVRTSAPLVPFTRTAGTKVWAFDGLRDAPASLNATEEYNNLFPREDDSEGLSSPET
jgi:hypothetical protein